MLHRATWKFSSLRVHTRTYVEGARVRGSVPAGVWGALRLDRSVNGTARPACVCVGGGAHRGTCWWPSENAFDVYHPPGTRPADYISRDRADFTNTGRVEYVRAPNGGPPLRSTHVVDREEGVAPDPLFLPPPAPSRDPQRSDSFFLSSLRYVRLIHAFPGGQAWWLPLNRAWTREPRVNASIGERDIVMGSGLISRKDSLEQLWWKGDDTDFVWISIEVSTFWKITVLRGCV